MLFTEEEIQTIRVYYPTMGKKIISLIPNHTINSIATKAEDMGILVINHEIMFHLEKEDALRLAMAVDCEGTITLRVWHRKDKKDFYHPKVSIYNTNYRLIEWANNIIAPIIPRYITPRDRIPTRNTIWKRQYQIDIRGVSPVFSLLTKLLPFFILKREQAELIIKFCKTRIGKPIRQPYTDTDAEIRRKLQELNKRGL